MNTCPACDQHKTMIGLEGHYTRPRLFNWITILLVTAWVVVVGVVAETAQNREPGVDTTPPSILETLSH